MNLRLACLACAVTLAACSGKDTPASDGGLEQVDATSAADTGPLAGDTGTVPGDAGVADGGATAQPGAFEKIDPSGWMRALADSAGNYYLGGAFVAQRPAGGTAFSPYGGGAPAVSSAAMKYGLQLDSSETLWTNICAGGVYRIPKGGGAWTQAGTQTNTACTAQALFVDRDDHVYVGDRVAQGVLKLPKGTDTWQTITTGHEDTVVTLSGTPNGDLFTGGKVKGVYKLPAGGDTFQLVNGTTFPPGRVFNLGSDPAGNLYAQCGDVGANGGIYRLDQGATEWTRLTVPFATRAYLDGEVTNLVFDAQSTAYVVGPDATTDQHGLYQVAKGGTTLTLVTSVGLPLHGAARHLARDAAGNFLVTTDAGVFLSKP